MRELKARCLADNPQSRPLFDEIAQVLGKVVADGNIPASLPVVTGPAAINDLTECHAGSPNGLIHLAQPWPVTAQ